MGYIPDIAGRTDLQIINVENYTPLFARIGRINPVYMHASEDIVTRLECYGGLRAEPKSTLAARSYCAPQTLLYICIYIVPLCSMQVSRQGSTV